MMKKEEDESKQTKKTKEERRGQTKKEKANKLKGQKRVAFAILQCAWLALND